MTHCDATCTQFISTDMSEVPSEDEDESSQILQPLFDVLDSDASSDLFPHSHSVGEPHELQNAMMHAPALAPAHSSQAFSPRSQSKFAKIHLFVIELSIHGLIQYSTVQQPDGKKKGKQIDNKYFEGEIFCNESHALTLKQQIFFQLDSQTQEVASQRNFYFAVRIGRTNEIIPIDFNILDDLRRHLNKKQDSEVGAGQTLQSQRPLYLILMPNQQCPQISSLQVPSNVDLSAVHAPLITVASPVGGNSESSVMSPCPSPTSRATSMEVSGHSQGMEVRRHPSFTRPPPPFRLSHYTSSALSSATSQEEPTRHGLRVRLSPPPHLQHRVSRRPSGGEPGDERRNPAL